VKGTYRVFIDDKTEPPVLGRVYVEWEMAPTVEQCRKRHAAALKDIECNRNAFAEHIRGGLVVDGNGRKWSRYDHEVSQRQRMFGRGLSRILAAHKRPGLILGNPSNWTPDKADYAALDQLLGYKALRSSNMVHREKEHGYWPTIVSRYGGGEMREGKREPWTPESYDYARALDMAKADAEFWRECELLAGGERDEWQPGIFDSVAA
jgi:hypothetical protein